MVERVSIFKPCDITYDVYDKPVRYTEEFLKDLASRTMGCSLVEKHYGKSIGNISNVTFTDGELFVDVDSSESLQKFSPSFDDLTLVEEEDCFIATGGYLVEVASTVKPRLDNSDDGGSKMGEEGNKTQEWLSNEVGRLNQEIAKKDVVIKRNKEKLEEFEKMEKELNELRETNEKNQKLIDEQKPIIEKYNEYTEKNHEKLLKEVAKDNPDLEEKYKHFSNEDLELILESSKIEEQPAKGAGSSNAPGLGEGDGVTDEEAEQKARSEAVEGMFGDLFGKEE